MSCEHAIYRHGYCERCVQELKDRLATAERELDEANKRLEWMRCAHLLIAQSEAFVRVEGGVGPFWVDAEVTADGTPALSLNVNDTFTYACADDEPFSYEDAPALLKIGCEEGWPGIVRWVSEHRGGAEPIEPVRERILGMADLRAQLAAAQENGREASLLLSDCQDWLCSGTTPSEEEHAERMQRINAILDADALADEAGDVG